MGNPNGQIVNRSHSGGFSITEYWTKLFQENEYNYEINQHMFILTDLDITEQMLDAFPSRWQSQIFRLVSRVRNVYNRGTWNKGIKPKIQSVRYRRLVNGQCIQITARGRILETTENQYQIRIVNR